MPIPYAPPPFNDKNDAPGDPVWAFTKFEDATYQISFSLVPIRSGRNMQRGWASVKATIRFNSAGSSRPVFEFMTSLASNIEVELNGTDVDYRVVTPKSAGARSKFFGINHPVNAGTHTVVISFDTELRIRKRNSAFSFMRKKDPGVYWHFRMSDGRPKKRLSPEDDCNFLGRYLPTNLEFDDHPKKIQFEFNKIAGSATKKLHLYTNGSVNQGSTVPAELDPETRYEVVFPDDFRSSSVFFYLCDPEPVDKTLVKAEVTTDGGTTLSQDITIFGPKTATGRRPSTPADYEASVKTAAETIMEDFEAKFPTNHVILLAGRQGMEYAGAAEISGGNVLHELFHLFIGRFIVPTDGPSGWWDEATAHWYVSGQFTAMGRPDKKAQIGSGPLHRRWTSKQARSTGVQLIAYLDHRTSGEGGIMEFLKTLVGGTNSIKALNSQEFRRELETWATDEFRREFDDFVSS